MRPSRIKRLFDVTVAAILLVLLSPLFAVVVLLIRLTSGSPVLFRQRRIGRNGQVFTFLKFRSMVANAEQLGPLSTQDNDARLTRVGVWLRRTSIDELPQLINVLRGEMSLVGPRAFHVKAALNWTSEELRLRHRIWPGITGLAQIRGRSEISAAERKGLDLFYVQHWSIWLDLRILAETFLVVLTGRGVN